MLIYNMAGDIQRALKLAKAPRVRWGRLYMVTV